ncbi:hypothetical protein [Ereboglobus sp. PH5-10]|uniref:hypothetical protein n=1 Tax=Ereboglobus sp. PH5-10 TaxID=2940629 RepID=UPI00240763F8|nr:hypothetical protein [Ereboglobus sp. PH5-10]
MTKLLAASAPPFDLSGLDKWIELTTMEAIEGLPFAYQLLLAALLRPNVILFLSILHFAVMVFTASHCLRNCPESKQTPYLLVIIFIPVCGWLLYWLHNVSVDYAFNPDTMTRSRRSLDISEELLKPHTASPKEVEIAEQQAAAAAAANAKAVADALAKPTPSKPLHVIAQERREQPVSHYIPPAEPEKTPEQIAAEIAKDLKRKHSSHRPGLYVTGEGLSAYYTKGTTDKWSESDGRTVRGKIEGEK